MNADDTLPPAPRPAAVITGAASGLGLAMARIAVARGMNVVLADVQAAALDAALQELSLAAAASGSALLGHRLDVSRAAEVETLGAVAIARFGTPALVVNNAGVALGGLIWEQSVRDWEWVLGVNLMGVAHGVRVFVPAMLDAARADPGYRGHVVNTASMAGLVNTPNMGAYNVSKHAVVSLSETLFHDLALVTDRVRCSVLCPYFVPTGIHRSHQLRPGGGSAGRTADGAGGAADAPTRSQQTAQAMMDKAVTASRVSAADVAQRVFDAIDAGRFYVFSHPHALAGVQARFDDLLHGRNPSDPLAARPALADALRRGVAGD